MVGSGGSAGFRVTLYVVVVAQAQHAKRRQMLEMLGTAISLLQAIG